jgi:hypothetical protein
MFRRNQLGQHTLHQLPYRITHQHLLHNTAKITPGTAAPGNETQSQGVNYKQQLLSIVNNSQENYESTCRKESQMRTPSRMCPQLPSAVQTAAPVTAELGA